MLFPIDLVGELIAIRPDVPYHAVLLPDWKRSLSGTVLARGPNVTSVAEGDRVSFGAASGMDAVLSGQEIRILKERDLDFVYEPYIEDPLNGDHLPCKCKPGNPCVWHG